MAEVNECTICKEPLEADQEKTWLSCAHSFHKVCVDEYMAVHELGGDLSLVRCPQCRHGGRPLVPEPPPEFLEASEVAELFEERPVAAEAALLEELLAVPAVAADAEEANAAVRAVAAAEAAAEAAVAAREPPIVVVDEDDFEDRMQIKTNEHKTAPSPTCFYPRFSNYSSKVGRFAF